MKRLCTTVAMLALSAGLAMAQGGGGGGSGGGAGGSAGAGSSGSAAGSSSGNAAAQGAGTHNGAGTSPVPGASVNGPNNTGGPVPGLSTTQSPDLTVGRAPGVNPANPQDASRRGNPSDRTLPGAKSPQDMKAFDNGVPKIIAPEKR